MGDVAWYLAETATALMWSWRRFSFKILKNLSAATPEGFYGRALYPTLQKHEKWLRD